MCVWHNRKWVRTSHRCEERFLQWRWWDETKGQSLQHLISNSVEDFRRDPLWGTSLASAFCSAVSFIMVMRLYADCCVEGWNGARGIGRCIAGIDLNPLRASP